MSVKKTELEKIFAAMILMLRFRGKWIIKSRHEKALYCLQYTNSVHYIQLFIFLSLSRSYTPLPRLMNNQLTLVQEMATFFLTVCIFSYKNSRKLITSLLYYLLLLLSLLTSAFYLLLTVSRTNGNLDQKDL